MKISIDTYTRESQKPHLYIVGCSFAKGEGLGDQSNRYGQLLAAKLNMPPVFLVRSGSSIDWAVDQLIRSNVQPGDTVIWGITNIHRVGWYFNHECVKLTVNWRRHPGNEQLLGHSKYINQMLADPARVDNAIISVLQATAFCKKLSVKLYIVGNHVMPFTDDFKKFDSFLHQQSNYIPLPNPVDVIDTHGHPGPSTHLEWANSIHDHILKNKGQI